jgi:hypothetical protein
LIEGSDITDAEERELTKYVDHLYKQNVIGIDKSRGEVILLASYFSSDSFKRIRQNIKTISKLSGRYELNEKFNFNLYDEKASVINKENDVYNTRYYRFHIDSIDRFIEKLNAVFESINYMDIEHAFYLHQIFPMETLVHPETLGVCGYNAPVGYLQID